MSKKNKRLRNAANLPNQHAVLVPPSTTLSSETAPAPVEPTAEQAHVEINRVHDAAVAQATDAEVEAVSSAQAPSELEPAFDIKAAAKKAREALQLCEVRGQRLADLEQKLEARDQEAAKRDKRLDEHEGLLEQSERVLRQRDDEVKKLLAREEDVLRRELEADAGFSWRNAESLALLEKEAKALRDEISRARQTINEERANWEDELRAARAELAQTRSANEKKCREEVEIEKATVQVQLDELAKQRRQFEKDKRALQDKQEILDEDRESLKARADQLAARKVETLKLENAEIMERLAAAREECGRLNQKLREHEEAKRALGNLSPTGVQRELTELRTKCESLTQQLAQRPSQIDTERLAQLERENEKLQGDRARLTQEREVVKRKLDSAQLEMGEVQALRDLKAAAESQREALRSALEALRAEVGDLSKRADNQSPFPACSEMDRNADLRTPPGQLINSIPDLAKFCVNLRDQIAADKERPLYYSLRDVRCFVAGLAMSHLHLLHGISGTGKTSLPIAVAKALGAGHKVIEVQAGWRDRQDLLGHYNTFEKKYYETEFLKALYEAQTPLYSSRPYLIVLDEMNLSHPEQYFADLLSALERPANQRELHLMTATVNSAPFLFVNGQKLKIPPNVWFVGTANQDETTKDFADKTYDRAHVMELPSEHTPFSPKNVEPTRALSFGALSAAFDATLKSHAKASDDAYGILNEHFKELLASRFNVGWGNRLERHMSTFAPVVVAAGGSKDEAIDHILATKLLRKIRDRHDTRPEDLKELKDTIALVFDGSGTGEQSLAIVDAELRRHGVVEVNK